MVHTLWNAFSAVSCQKSNIIFIVTYEWLSTRENAKERQKSIFNIEPLTVCNVYAQPIAYNLLKIVHATIHWKYIYIRLNWIRIDSSLWIVYAEHKQVYLCNLNSIIDQFIRNNLLGRKFDICRQIMSSS